MMSKGVLGHVLDAKKMHWSAFQSLENRITGGSVQTVTTGSTFGLKGRLAPNHTRRPTVLAEFVGTTTAGEN